MLAWGDNFLLMECWSVPTATPPSQAPQDLTPKTRTRRCRQRANARARARADQEARAKLDASGDRVADPWYRPLVLWGWFSFMVTSAAYRISHTPPPVIITTVCVQDTEARLFSFIGDSSTQHSLCIMLVVQTAGATRVAHFSYLGCLKVIGSSGLSIVACQDCSKLTGPVATLLRPSTCHPFHNADHDFFCKTGCSVWNAKPILTQTALLHPAGFQPCCLLRTHF